MAIIKKEARDKKEIRDRIEKLKKEINHHRYLYHALDRQEISEAALDSLKHELFKLEKQYPEFVSPDSPTQRIGGQPLKKFSKIRHSQPVLSMEDIFDFQELRNWEDYMSDYFKKKHKGQIFVSAEDGPLYFCERKIDGIDIVLTYQKGILVTAATRGNGLIGEDVTQNIKTVDAVPLRLQRPIDVVVRGEVFMRKKDFTELNRRQEAAGQPEFANPRNVVAGSIRQLDPKITAKRRLDCYVFEIITDLGQKTHQQVHQILKELGFKIDTKAKLCRDLEDVRDCHTEWEREREKCPFNYDGVVVVLNDVALEKKLGFVGKSPRWMRAYKFPGEEAATVVREISVQIGRTGVLTPVAHLQPTRVMGTLISRATLHNQDEIDRLDVRVGDTVIIEKAGDVIPAVIKVLKNLRTGKEKKFKMPNNCPVCNSPVTRHPGEVAYYCPNKECFASEHRRISHFVGKQSFDIEGLGPKIVIQLMNQGLIRDAADIFNLTAGDLEPLERFAEKSAANLSRAINQSKKIDLARFIQALGIRHIGEQSAADLAGHFGSFEKFARVDLSTLQSLPEIGPKMAQSIVDWFQNKDNRRFLEKLKKAGVEIRNHRPERARQTLKGKSFVLTGTLKSMSREKAKEKIQFLGGRISETVSRRTDFIVVGEEPGSKYEKAKGLGVKIINEEEFLRMIR